MSTRSKSIITVYTTTFELFFPNLASFMLQVRTITAIFPFKNSHIQRRTTELNVTREYTAKRRRKKEMQNKKEINSEVEVEDEDQRIFFPCIDFIRGKWL